MFRFAFIISPAALKSLSTAVEVAGGVRYLVIKDWIKGKDNSSHIHLLTIVEAHLRVLHLTALLHLLLDLGRHCAAFLALVSQYAFHSDW